MAAREMSVRSLVIILLGATLLCGCRDEPGQSGFQIPDRGGSLLVDIGGVGADTGRPPTDPGLPQTDPGPPPVDPGPKDEGADTADAADVSADLPDVADGAAEDALDAQDPGTVDEGDVAVDTADDVLDTGSDVEPDVAEDASEDIAEDVTEDVGEDVSEQGPLSERCGATQVVVAEPAEGEAVYLQTDGLNVVWLQKRALEGQQVEHLYWWSGQDPAQRYTETGRDQVSRRTELHLKGGVAFFIERRVDFDVVLRAAADAVELREVHGGSDEPGTFHHLRTDGTRTVWTGSARGGAADAASAVYYYDGANTTKLTAQGADAREPVVLGTKVAWSQAEGEDSAKVLLYEGGSTVFFAEGESEEVGAGDKVHPHLSGDNLIWVSKAGDALPQLHLHDGSAPRKLTDIGLLEEHSFDALGGEVVWIEPTGAGETYGRRMRHFSGGQTAQIVAVDPPHLGIHSPRIARDFFAWVGVRFADSTSLHVDAGSGPLNLSDVVPNDRSPQVVSSYAVGGNVVAYAVGPPDNSGIVTGDPTLAVGTPGARKLLTGVLGGAVLTIAQTEGEEAVHPIEHETVAGGVVVFRMVAPPEAEWVWVSMHNGCSE